MGEHGFNGNGANKSIDLNFISDEISMHLSDSHRIRWMARPNGDLFQILIESETMIRPQSIRLSDAFKVVKEKELDFN